MKHLNNGTRLASCSRKLFFTLWCMAFIGVASASVFDFDKRFNWINDAQQHALMFNDTQSNVYDHTGLTRSILQITDANSTFTVVGAFLCNGNANVLCGSLSIGGVALSYDTAAYHADPTVIQTWQSDVQHPNAIILQNNRTTCFFPTGSWYSVQRLLDGTSNAWSFNNHCIFRTGNTGVSGFVRLNNGFTILPNASTMFDTFITANGGIDLRETGVVIIGGALGLGSSVTLSSGGKIDGRGNQLVLGGDLTFPANKILHIMSDTIIDGLDHTLMVGDYGQIFVDTSVTLTLKNLTFSSGAKTAIFPPLRCAGSQSKLVLDNVTLSPGADIPFYQGQMFVYNEVHFSGTSALVYTSPQSSFIMPSSLLTFDPSTTFSFAPATMSKDQIIMANTTSSLVFNGSTLKSTDTGLQLTKGTLTYQGSAKVDTKNGFYFSSLTTFTSGIYAGASSGNPYGRICWSPDSKLFAVGAHASVLAARVYSLYGSGGTLGVYVASLPYIYHVHSMSWSSDGRYIALGTLEGTPRIYIYSVQGTTCTFVTSITYYSGGYINDLAWSPDGKYIMASGLSGSPYTQTVIYSFNGVSLAYVTAVAYRPGSTAFVRMTAWHPSGKFIGIVGEYYAGINHVQIYGFDGTTLTFKTGRQWGASVLSLNWSPDGNYLAVGGNAANYADAPILTTDNIRIYRFNSVTGDITPVIGRYYGTSVYNVAWHPDGKTLAAVGTGAANGGTNNPFSDTNLVRIYQFTGTALSGLVSYQPTGPINSATYIHGCSWDQSGNLLGLIGFDASSIGYYGILNVNFVRPTNPQAMTNSLVYGNSALGSSANLTVNGAPATLRGQIFTENDGFNAPVLNLNSDTTIASNSILHITRNTIIEGGAHTLTAGDYGQLFVDNAVTVTLKNMTVSSGAKTSIFPPLRCAGQNSKLVLDNVTLSPGADIPFYQGQLFVYDDVHFTGTSAFVYTSPQSSFIMPSSLLTFDPSTTFSFAPATMSKDQIIMSDATSSLVFNGSSLKCTDTGLRLTKGTLEYQGSATVDTKNGFYFSSLTTLTSGIYYKYTNGPYAMRCCWSSDGRFFSAASDGGKAARVYKVYGAGGLLGTTFAILSATEDYPYTVAWSPDGRHTTVGAYNYWAAYSFNGTTFTYIKNALYGSAILSLAYSPDGTYLAFGFGIHGSYGCQVYSFNGTNYTQVGSTISYSGDMFSIKWHPSGNYIALAGATGLFVYSFNGLSFTQVSSKVWNTTIYDIGWSPDGSSIAAGGATPNVVDGNILAADNIRVYSFNKSTGALTAVIGRYYGTAVYGIDWHQDGKTLAVGGGGAANGGTNNPFSDTNLVRIYQFTGTVLNGLLSYTLASPLSTITTIWDCKWDPIGNHLGIFGYNSSDNTQYYGILKANFVPSTNQQALTNSLVYGNSVLGSSANLTVNGLPTTVRGQIFPDNSGAQIINLKSDTTIASNSVLHITGDIIIDGGAHTLTIGDYGQLFVDNAITLTLKNMIFSSGAKTSVFPPLRCAGSTSRVAFDDMTLFPGADIPFYQGQMFIYNDVHFSGTSAFVYISPQSSFIMPSSSLTFDPSTTFSFTPARASKDQIIMADTTSSLVFNGSTLKCTDTGLRLTKGTLEYQGNVTVDTKNSLYLSSLTTVTSGIYYKHTGGISQMRACWSSDGNFFALAGDGGTPGRVYQLYADGLIGKIVADLALGGNYYSVVWSPDRRYVTTVSSNYLASYAFNGLTFTLASQLSAPATLVSIAYSPDGKYIAVGAYNGGLYIYTFNGTSYKQVGSTLSYSGNLRGIRWHPRSNYIAIGGDVGALSIYSFNGSSLTQVASKSWGAGKTIWDIDWSPDGQYIVAGGATPNVVDGNILAADNIRIYSFNTVTGALTAVIGRKYGTTAYSVGWHPDGKTLVVGGIGAANGGTNNPFNDTNLVRLYQFTGTALNGLLSYTLSSPLSNITEMFSTYWDQSGNYLCLAGIANDHTQYYGILKANFVPSTNPQALTNSLVYGNAALGSSANLTVNGAPTTLRGQIFTENDGFNAPVLNLNSDTTIASNSILHITRNTIIEGGAHTLTAGDYGQLFVDNAVTVTLKNMIVSSGAKTSIFPPLRCAGQNSKLVLDNVTLLSGADIPFYQGQLFVQDDVHFTGTSAFVYTSPQSSFILPSSSLTFDPSTTFSFAPATASKDQIIMSNATSSLVFNGSTLKCTDTGLRLTKGSLTYQGSVTVDTKSSLYLSSLISVTSVNYGAVGSGYIIKCSWRSDGRFLAVGGQNPITGGGSGFSNTDEIRVYSFDGTNLTAVTSRPYGTSGGGNLYGLEWSPDGLFLAVGGYNPASGGNTGFSNAYYLRVYRFDEAGSTLTPVANFNVANLTYDFTWSHDGKYIAYCTYGSTAYVYRFNGQSLVQAASGVVFAPSGYADYVNAATWHPSGRFVVFAGGENRFGSDVPYARLTLFSFDGASLTPVTSFSIAGQLAGIASTINGAVWSPDGRYLEINGSNLTAADGNIPSNSTTRVYEFNGTNSLIPVTGISYNIVKTAWLSDGKVLVLGGGIYSFNGKQLSSMTTVPYGTTIYSSVWHPRGTFLAYGGYYVSNIPAKLNIYRNVWGNQPNPQAMTNSLVYGNAALGSGANLTLNGNYSTLRGNVLNQNV